MYVKEYMSTNVITVNSDTLIHDAEKIMRDNKIHRLPVVDKGKLVGLLTRRKLREASPSPATSLSIWEINYLLAKMKVKDVMEKSLFTVTPDTTVEQAVSEAQKRGIGTLLVVDKDKPDRLIGIATTTDLYKLTTEILGFGQPGARLHILEPSKAGSCYEVMDIINKRGVRILSMFHVTPPSIGREDCIVQIDTEDASQIIEELKSKGYGAQIRPR
jgi:acetoin utilization protein AcuB